jgi:hypothetical protein
VSFVLYGSIDASLSSSTNCYGVIAAFVVKQDAKATTSEATTSEAATSEAEEEEEEEVATPSTSTNTTPSKKRPHESPGHSVCCLVLLFAGTTTTDQPHNI